MTDETSYIRDVEVRISAKRLELTPRLEDYATEKISRLDRFVAGLDVAEVHLEEESNPRIAEKVFCEVTVTGHGHNVRCKVHEVDGFAAIDSAVAKLERQLRKLKTRLLKRWHASGDPKAQAAVEAFEPELDEGATDDEAAAAVTRIVKSKKFHIASMTPDEAVLELELVNHDFYFFVNSETERAAIVYRRDDGAFGLIDVAG